MKIVGGLLISAGLITLSGFIHGQEATLQTQSILGSADQPVSQPDSVVRIVADSQGLQLLSPDQIPGFGTFWVVYGAQPPVPLPFLPYEYDPVSMPVFSLGPDGQFLVDATGGILPQPTVRQALRGVSSSTLLQAQANMLLDLITRVQETQANTKSAIMMGVSGEMSSMDVPFPGDGGDSGGTNTFFASSYTAPDYGTNLWIANFALSSNNAVGIVSNTAADILYEIQSLTDLSQSNWVSEGFLSGSELTNGTPMSVATSNRSRLFLRIRSWADNTGTGIPDWWWLEFFGQITNVDPYAPDPAGDGYNNLQKFQMGLNPANFISPPTPTGLYAYVDSTGTNVLLSWNLSPGPVQHYVLGRYDYNPQTFQWVYTSLGQVNGNVTAYEDMGGLNPASPYSPLWQVSAIYSGGSSPPASSYIHWYPPTLPTYNYNLRVTACLVRNATGHWQVMFSGISTNVPTVGLNWYSYDYYYEDPDTAVETENISVSNLTNGCFVISDADATNNLGNVIYVQGIGPNNEQGEPSQAGFLYSDAPCFVDGRQHLKQNLLFEIRAATLSQPCSSLGGADTNYVESSIFSWSAMSTWYGQFEYLAMNDLWPFTANYMLHQRLYDTNTAVPANFVWHTNLVTVPAPAVLGVGEPYWIYQNAANPADVGLSGSSNPPNAVITLQANAYNLFGLQVEATWTGGYDLGTGLPWGSITNYAGQAVNADPNGIMITVICADTASPTLQAAGYYFAPITTPGPALPNPSTPNQLYPVPVETGFANSNKTGVMVTSVGNPTVIGGWAKYTIQSSNPTKYAYLGQYFVTNAFVVTNGIVTTNTTGILSPYGDFFPTQAGQAAMTTMPDIDTGQQGTGIVRVISLNADANHDGTMDFSYFGPDQTSPSRPFRFWVNDDTDLGDYGGDGVPGQGNAADGVVKIQGTWKIHGRRDLVDFFPVYLNIGSLFQSNAVNAGISVTDSNWQFVLSQADGALRFAYTDLTPTNYMNFLRDSIESSNLAYAPLTTISNSGVALSHLFVGGIATNNQGVILVEAAAPTTQPLMLSIYHGTNLISQTSLYLSISGVEQMFRCKNLLLNTSSGDFGMPADRLNDWDVPNEPDTINKNFVFLHGYNVNPLQARGVAADMFKRMYWSGSHAKFYAVTWEGYDSQWFGKVTVNYQSNVFNAFNTAPALATFIASLTNGPVVTAAHSLGNMVVLDSLNEYYAPISQYFMIDAAVPMEAIDPSTGTNIYMTVSAWQAYSNRLYAANWCKLWTNLDYRSTLSWSRRLTNFNSAQVYDFYSSGEEVLREWNLDAPTNLLTFGAQALANYEVNESPISSFVWVWQEKAKGVMAYDGVLGSTHGGWKFNTNYASLTIAQANALPASQLQTNAFFDLASPSFGSADLALYGGLGSVYAYQNRNRILSDAIPALSWAVGSHAVPSLNPLGRNFDMQALYENGWPPGRAGNPAETDKWHHSDFHEVAYTFTYPLFDKLVTTGNLK